MKITIYELVRLAKDGKAPKQIKYSNRIYDYNEKQEDYECFIGNYYDYLLDNTNTFQQFNDLVEIIEEDKEVKNNFTYIYNCQDSMANANFENIRTTLTELIDEVNKLKGKYE